MLHQTTSMVRFCINFHMVKYFLLITRNVETLCVILYTGTHLKRIHCHSDRAAGIRVQKCEPVFVKIKSRRKTAQKESLKKKIIIVDKLYRLRMYAIVSRKTERNVGISWLVVMSTSDWLALLTVSTELFSGFPFHQQPLQRRVRADQVRKR